MKAQDVKKYENWAVCVRTKTGAYGVREPETVLRGVVKQEGKMCLMLVSPKATYYVPLTDVVRITPWPKPRNPAA